MSQSTTPEDPGRKDTEKPCDQITPDTAGFPSASLPVQPESGPGATFGPSRSMLGLMDFSENAERQGHVCLTQEGLDKVRVLYKRALSNLLLPEVMMTELNGDTEYYLDLTGASRDADDALHVLAVISNKDGKRLFVHKSKPGDLLEVPPDRFCGISVMIRDERHKQGGGIRLSVKHYLRYGDYRQELDALENGKGGNLLASLFEGEIARTGGIKTNIVKVQEGLHSADGARLGNLILTDKDGNHYFAHAGVKSGESILEFGCLFPLEQSFLNRNSFPELKEESLAGGFIEQFQRNGYKRWNLDRYSRDAAVLRSVIRPWFRKSVLDYFGPGRLKMEFKAVLQKDSADWSTAEIFVQLGLSDKHGNYHVQMPGEPGVVSNGLFSGFVVRVREVKRSSGARPADLNGINPDISDGTGEVFLKLQGLCLSRELMNSQVEILGSQPERSIFFAPIRNMIVTALISERRLKDDKWPLITRIDSAAFVNKDQGQSVHMVVISHDYGRHVFAIHRHLESGLVLSDKGIVLMDSFL